MNHDEFVKKLLRSKAVGYIQRNHLEEPSGEYIWRTHSMKKIFEQKQLRHLTLKNRLIRSATWEGIAALNGMLFRHENERTADTVMIAITGIHDNFYSNPFYYNIGDTLNSGGIDFIYAQTNDAFGRIQTVNVNTGKNETIGSWNERFSYTDEDIDAYLTFAAEEGYEHIILAGHSVGANKVIYYLSRHRDPRVEHFFLLSPASLTYMMSGVTDREKRIIKEQVECGDGDQMLPFPFMG